MRMYDLHRTRSDWHRQNPKDGCRHAQKTKVKNWEIKNRLKKEYKTKSKQDV
jgi:hypothetical protein